MSATEPTEAQRFPIGRFARQDRYTNAERAELVERLNAQPTHLAAALSGLTDTDYERPYRSGGWTVRQLVHHVADSHVNAYTRVKLTLTEDSPTIKPYRQDAWAELADSALSPLISLTLFTAVHERLVTVLRTVTDEQAERQLLHPETGPMTLGQLMALYAWHGDHHVAHIRGVRETR
jgi:uncharacterized damage-inducible protein DinB